MSWMILCQLIMLHSTGDQIIFEERLGFISYRNGKPFCCCTAHLHQMLLGSKKTYCSYPLFQIHHIHWVRTLLLYIENNSSNCDLCVVICSDTNGADFVCDVASQVSGFLLSWTHSVIWYTEQVTTSLKLDMIPSSREGMGRRLLMLFDSCLVMQVSSY